MDTRNERDVVAIVSAPADDKLLDPNMSEGKEIATREGDSRWYNRVEPTLSGKQEAGDLVEDSNADGLSTSDLVKIFELALSEIRSTQTLALSVLGFSVIVIGVIQKVHDSKVHSAKLSYICWALGVAFCALGAILIGRTRRHFSPLKDLIMAGQPGSRYAIFKQLRRALSKAHDAVVLTHRYRFPIAIGVILEIFAIGYEGYKEMFR